ncbi:MAG: hypothetical protein ACLFWB_12470, partial [Armatimonadota bacterium]
VEGNVVTVGAPVRLKAGAHVHGDVAAIGGAIEIHDEATVDGSRVHLAAPWIEDLISNLLEETEKPEEEIAEAEAGGQEEAERKEMEERQRAAGPSGEGIVRFGEDVVVEPGEIISEDIIVFGGTVDVSGTVKSDIAALDGPVHIRPGASVSGDVVAIGGDVSLQADTRVGGDVVTLGGKLQKASSATIGGSHQTLTPQFHLPDFERASRSLTRIGRRIINNLAFLVLLLILVVALPKQMDAVAVRVSEEPGRALLYGIIGLLLVLPMLAVLVFMVVTWALIPLFIAAVAGLGLVGMVGMDILIGRKLAAWMRLSTTSLIGVAIIGFVILAAAGLLAELPVVGAAGGIFLLAVFVFGFGGALMTGFGTDPEGTWLGGGGPHTPQGPPPGGQRSGQSQETPATEEAQQTEPATPGDTAAPEAGMQHETRPPHAEESPQADDRPGVQRAPTSADEEYVYYAASEEEMDTPDQEPAGEVDAPEDRPDSDANTDEEYHPPDRSSDKGPAEQ